MLSIPAPVCRAPAPTEAMRPMLGPVPTDHAFLALLEAFRGHGGLARGDEVAQRIRRHQGIGLGALARRIVERAVICFEWRGEFWLPLLQFDARDMSMRPLAGALIAELSSAFDGWELCCWLATPNVALDDQAPLDVLAAEPDAVLRAARLDRLVACG